MGFKSWLSNMLGFKIVGFKILGFKMLLSRIFGFNLSNPPQQTVVASATAAYRPMNYVGDEMIGQVVGGIFVCFPRPNGNAASSDHLGTVAAMTQ